MTRKYNKRGRSRKHKRKIIYQEDNLHRYDGKMIFNFKYDILYPFFNIIKYIIIIGCIAFTGYHLFNLLK